MQDKEVNQLTSWFISEIWDRIRFFLLFYLFKTENKKRENLKLINRQEVRPWENRPDVENNNKQQQQQKKTRRPD